MMALENDSLDSKKRFSSRVENYIKYRPSYPLGIIDFLKNERVLEKKSIIADIGSGTGKLTKIFLKKRKKVYGVEPNGEMRHAAERLLKKYPNFVSINGSAEKTSLDNESVDVIIVGQAFHWFNINEAKSEFLRILKPDHIY